jgi:hypothetical protein
MDSRVSRRRPIGGNRSGRKNNKHPQQWTNTLSTYAYPILGHLPVSAIDTGRVLAVLQQAVEATHGALPLWQCKTETASRVRGRMESILDWATFRGYRQGEPPRVYRRLFGLSHAAWRSELMG